MNLQKVEPLFKLLINIQIFVWFYSHPYLTFLFSSQIYFPAIHFPMPRPVDQIKIQLCKLTCTIRFFRNLSPKTNSLSKYRNSCCIVLKLASRINVATKAENINRTTCKHPILFEYIEVEIQMDDGAIVLCPHSSPPLKNLVQAKMQWSSAAWSMRPILKSIIIFTILGMDPTNSCCQITAGDNPALTKQMKHMQLQLYTFLAFLEGGRRNFWNRSWHPASTPGTNIWPCYNCVFHWQESKKVSCIDAYST